jgi:hypothetical protein
LRSSISGLPRYGPADGRTRHRCLDPMAMV